MARLNGYEVRAPLTKRMSGKQTILYLSDKYSERRLEVKELVMAAFRHGISARSVGIGGYYAIYPVTRSPVRFVVEESPPKSAKKVPVRVAPKARIGYASRVRRSTNMATIPQEENLMAARTATKAPARKAKAKPAPEPEPEELDDELEDEDDELEDEEDDELDDEDEDEDDDDESDEDEDEDEEDEEEDEDEDVEDEADEDEDDEPDYTPYATKAITPTMKDFAVWMDRVIFKPTGTSIKEVGRTDPVRLVAIAGTARMEFQKSSYNIEQREKRQQEAAAAKAAKASQPKAKPVAKGSKVVAKGAKTAAKPAAKPAAKATRPATKSTTTARPKAGTATKTAGTARRRKSAF